jgi:hypothetical protein
MPFPEPETALASTIDAGADGQSSAQNCTSGRRERAFYDFSITYTRTQQLRGRVGDNLVESMR